jgi:hypothetical protein
MAKFTKDNQPKSRGRPKGSKSLKKVLKADQVMADLNFNPVQFLVTLAQSKTTPDDLKVKIGIELSSLINAKPKAKEETAEEPTPDEPDLSDISTADLLQLVKKP